MSVNKAGYSTSQDQEKAYRMLEELKAMAKTIPNKYQQRIPYDLLSSLAQVLLNETLFAIVKELLELQHMNEAHLSRQRHEIITRHKNEKNAMLKSQKIELQKATCQGRAHVALRLPKLHEEQYAQMEDKHQNEIDKFDRRVLAESDEKTHEQQQVLNQASIPGFFVTDDPIQIRIQMYIMRFIIKLGNINPQSYDQIY